MQSHSPMQTLGLEYISKKNKKSTDEKPAIPAAKTSLMLESLVSSR